MNKTILIVDDEKELCEIIAMQIDIPGVDIIESNSSAEAFQIVLEKNIDLVVTDFKMPGMNGFEFIAKAHEQLEKPPTFFLMTGFSDFNLRELQKYGINKLYSKPGDLSNMISDIQKFFD